MKHKSSWSIDSHINPCQDNIAPKGGKLMSSKPVKYVGRSFIRRQNQWSQYSFQALAKVVDFYLDSGIVVPDTLIQEIKERENGPD